MSKNMNSTTKLTEFAPLSPVESSQPVVATLFSKLFGYGKSSGDNAAASASAAADDGPADSSEDSESWKRLDAAGKNDNSPPADDSSSGVGYSLDASEGRSLPNVLKRISNIVALRSGNLRSYKDSELRSYWMPDSVAKQCYDCGERFTTFRRRHHCRVCGQIFCWKCCSDEIPGKIMGCIGDLRVCTYCCKVALSYLQSSDMRSVLSADLKALQEGLQVKYGGDSNPPRQQRTNDDPLDDETRAYRKASVGYMEEKYALGRSSSSYLGTQGRSLVLKNSAPLRMIYEELFRSSRAIQLQTHRVRLKSYHNCFVGNELINWLMANNKTATRAQAAAIAQALLEAGFIESAQSEDSFGDGTGLFKPAKLSLMQSVDLSDENQSICDSQEPAWVTNIPQHDSTTDSESETRQPSFQTIGRLPSSSSSFYLDLNVEASTATLKRPTSEDLASIATTTADESPGTIATAADPSIDHSVVRSKDHEQTKKSDRCPEFVASDELLSDTLRVQEFNERNCWHRAKNLSTINEEITSYNAITAAYRKHEYSLIGQLLKREGLAENWTEPIISLARQIVDQVRPDLHHNAEDMDIRQYVQIKTSPGGCKNDCEIVSGVVCSKNVAHRGMNAMIAHPKILLLKCGLMYQRVEGKLLSLEPVMLQENEYLGHTVSRITALGPDIVLVHRSVSRLAQDRFRQRGVTLVLNVKLSVLERVARCTGGTIVNTIDAHLTTRYKLGTCKKFYLRNFPAETNRFKTLMYFEGCPNAHLGATILLRGGNIAELKRVKRVTSTMIFAAYSARLEISFLMDEFARPPFPSDDSFLDDREKEKEASVVDDRAKKSSGVAEDSRSIFDVSPPGTPQRVGSETKKLSSLNSRAIDEASLESSMLAGPEASKRVTSLLDEDRDPYDTLRLFKSRPKQPAEGGDKVSDERPIKSGETPEGSSSEPKFSEKIVPEDKRARCESISDQSDPLHQYLRRETDDEDQEDDNYENVYPEDEENPGDDEEIANYSVAASSSGLNARGSLSVAELPLSNKFKKALDERILSFSPYLKFAIPYLETPTGRRCLLRRFFPKDIYRSRQLTDARRPEASTRSSGEAERPSASSSFLVKPRHEFVRAKLTSSVEARSVQALLANFRASGSRLRPRDTVLRGVSPQDKSTKNRNEETSTRDESIDCLEPENHQRLSVLFCSFSHCRDDSPAVFCVNPWIVNMDLYGRNDIALGGFLERYCLTDEYECPAQSCRAEIAGHARRFAHDDGCIYIMLNSLGSEHFRHDNNDQILMWSRCAICKIVSPVVPMSSDTWSLSFAKYLELRFHAGVYRRRGAGGGERTSGITGEEICRHSLHRDHCQYFTRRNMLATFKYGKIQQWEISLPPPLIRVRYGRKQYDSVIEEIKMLGLKSDEVFTSIREKLFDAQTLATAAAVSGATSGSGGELDALRQQLAKEQQYLRGKIEEIQLKITSPRLENKKIDCGGEREGEIRWLMFRVEDGIVIAKRLIHEAVTGWNARIQEITAARKRDDRAKRFNDKILIATGSNAAAAAGETDGYATEDAESQVEDSSPVSADYNAVDAVNAAGNAINDNNNYEGNADAADNDLVVPDNPDDIVVAQDKFHQQHQRSHSDVFPVSGDDLLPDKRRKKKTILSQLLPYNNTNNLIGNPLASFEHHSLPLGSVVPMVVYETEPSSIIAYALDSHDYKHALAEIIRSSRGNEQNTGSPLHRRKLAENRELLSGDLPQSGESRLQRPSVLSFLRGNSPSPASPIDNNEKINIATAEIASSANNTTSSNNNNNNAQNSNVEPEDPEKKATKAQTYIQVQFHDTTTNFYCRIYFAAQFAALRENVLPCGEDGFTRSLCRSVQWAARGGKSGSAFCKSRDDRFILKELSRLEMQIFLDFAPNYFAYMEKCQRTKEPTLLGKIVGVYRVSFKNNTTNAALRTSVLVMENLFYGRTITDKFDLKGSVRNRLVNPEEADSEGELVLLDENLLNMSCDSPLYIKSHSKAVLNRAIELDTKFLADNSVMDYSLLVGLDPITNELVLGIIDYIRTFTWDKKLETMVKKSGILGGQGKLPTIVSPEEYRARFIAAMDRYFLPVPDRWTGLDRGLESSSTS